MKKLKILALIVILLMTTGVLIFAQVQAMGNKHTVNKKNIDKNLLTEIIGKQNNLKQYTTNELIELFSKIKNVASINSVIDDNKKEAYELMVKVLLKRDNYSADDCYFVYEILLTQDLFVKGKEILEKGLSKKPKDVKKFYDALNFLYKQYFTMVDSEYAKRKSIKYYGKKAKFKSLYYNILSDSYVINLNSKHQKKYLKLFNKLEKLLAKKIMKNNDSLKNNIKDVKKEYDLLNKKNNKLDNKINYKLFKHIFRFFIENNSSDEAIVFWESNINYVDSEIKEYRLAYIKLLMTTNKKDKAINELKQYFLKNHIPEYLQKDILNELDIKNTDFRGAK